MTTTTTTTKTTKTTKTTTAAVHQQQQPSPPLSNAIPWSHRQDDNDYFFYDSWVKYNVSINHIALNLRKKVLAHGNRIMVGSYRLLGGKEGWKRQAVSMVQLDEPIIHMGICLGDNVAFLSVGDSVSLYQMPPEFCTWEMRELPFADVDLAVRIVIDTVLQCWDCDVGYNCHLLENIEHMLCRLIWSEHGEYDYYYSAKTTATTRGDYDFNSPDTWRRGVHCSQLVLLVLKRCVKHGALKIEDPGLEEEFLSVYSHTCCPGPMDRLIDRVWPQTKHFKVKYDWKRCFSDFELERTPVDDLLSGEHTKTPS
jgi:hypothetical protein